MLKTLGVIYSLNGNQSEARRMFHRLILALDSTIPTNAGDNQGGGGATRTDRVEAIILYGTTWERNGFFAGERVRDDGGGIEHGINYNDS